jgi:hypothetical protein
MQGRAREAWLVVSLCGVIAAGACSGGGNGAGPSDDSAGAEAVAGASEVGVSGSTGLGNGQAGGSSAAGAGPTAQGGATAGSTGEGEGGTAGARETGAAGSGEPGPGDLITSSGGPWPDSLTGACADADHPSACPKTGAPFFGQDASYRINVPTYVASESTLKDSVTGLTWQLSPEPGEQSQAEAAAYCDALELEGNSDWRLPTRLEYVSLLDEGAGSGYALPAAIALETSGAHWTSSSTGTTADGFFEVNDADGSWTVAIDTTPALVRCVEGAPLAGSLSVGADSTSDSMTGLEWQTTELDDSDLGWEEALAYCEALSHADKTDWRLPSIKELATLVDEAAVSAPVVDAASFGVSLALRYWSSTPNSAGPNAGFAFALETSFGSSPVRAMTDLAAARCVRTAD